MLRRFAISLVSLVALALVIGPAGAVSSVDSDAAVTYLASQQTPGTDHAAGAGSWDAGFEFQTSEVVLAIAEAAQTGPSWDAAAARAAVVATTNTDGLSGLGYLDDVAEAGVDPGVAAKLLLLAALPLNDGSTGFAPTAWDPAGDGGPVDLVVAFGGCGADPASYGFFGQTLVAMQASMVVCGLAGAAATETVLAAQQTNGGWSYDGDPSGATDADVDTTAAAVMALAGEDPHVVGPAINNALVFLADRQDPAGWWPGYDGEASPDSTSRATLAIAAAGYDPTIGIWTGRYGSPCDPSDPSDPGDYVSPDDALASLQQSDGSIAGPTTFSAVYSTAQAVQGLKRNWLPVTQAIALPPPPTVQPVDCVSTTVPGPTVLGSTLPAPDPTLPRTGGEHGLAIAAGVLCVAVGTALVVRRRRLT